MKTLQLGEDGILWAINSTKSCVVFVITIPESISGVRVLENKDSHGRDGDSERSSDGAEIRGESGSEREQGEAAWEEEQDNCCQHRDAFFQASTVVNFSEDTLLATSLLRRKRKRRRDLGMLECNPSAGHRQTLSSDCYNNLPVRDDGGFVQYVTLLVVRCPPHTKVGLAHIDLNCLFPNTFMSCGNVNGLRRSYEKIVFMERRLADGEGGGDSRGCNDGSSRNLLDEDKRTYYHDVVSSHPGATALPLASPPSPTSPPLQMPMISGATRTPPRLGAPPMSCIVIRNEKRTRDQPFLWSQKLLHTIVFSATPFTIVRTPTRCVNSPLRGRVRVTQAFDSAGTHVADAGKCVDLEILVDLVQDTSRSEEAGIGSAVEKTEDVVFGLARGGHGVAGSIPEMSMAQAGDGCVEGMRRSQQSSERLLCGQGPPTEDSPYTVYAVAEGQIQVLRRFRAAGPHPDLFIRANCAVIKHIDRETGGVWYSHYNHIQPHAHIKNNQYVCEGESIGVIGDVGFTTGIHLCFGCRAGQSTKEKKNKNRGYRDSDKSVMGYEIRIFDRVCRQYVTPTKGLLFQG